ncbi:MAG: flagellar motor switch protein FliM [Fibrobacteres bacterium]|nr:flagellar motor switch protein FliM [Fibrobacterota bacterium]
MSDILSQEEVDALLSAVSAGDMGASSSERQSTPSYSSESTAVADDRPVQIYDFRRPDRVSKDQMRTLQNLHEGYARLFSTTMTSYLRTLVEIELVSVDQLTYSEFIMSISNPSCIYVFQMEPLEGNAIFEINPSLVFYMVDRLFGGQGKALEQNRELTSIEESVMMKITERALSDLKDVWEHIGIFNPKIANYETNPQFVQVAPPSETVILVSLEVRMNNGSGLLSLCFPFMVLEGVIGKLSGESWMKAQRSSTRETEKIVRKEIETRSVSVSAEIGNLTLSVRDLLQLHKGDVLLLDRPADSRLGIKLNGQLKMEGKPGLIGRHKAVQVTGFINKEEMSYEQ